MFENLSEKLQRAFKSLRGQAVLSPENMEEALREIRLALLEADVNFKVVKQLIDHIQEKAIGQEVATALSPGEQVIKILRDELVEVLGRDTAKMKFASQPPTVVLMAGLQGSGKTTTSGKLANWLKNGGHRPLLVSVDAYRPAAREQVKVVAQPIKFIGVGERYDALEPFHPDRIVSRILGMGDILSLIERAESQIDRKKAEEMTQKALSGDGFSLEDFRDQLRQVRKMGSLQSLMGMLPSIGPFAGLQKHADKIDEKQINHVERSEEHTSELQSQSNLVCRLLLEKKK